MTRQTENPTLEGLDIVLSLPNVSALSKCTPLNREGMREPHSKQALAAKASIQLSAFGKTLLEEGNSQSSALFLLMNSVNIISSLER